MRIGLFDIECMGQTQWGTKWKFTNTTTTISHCTYGSEEEITQSALRQSRSWRRRAKMLKLPGGALRLSGMNGQKGKKQDTQHRNSGC